MFKKNPYLYLIMIIFQDTLLPAIWISIIMEFALGRDYLLYALIFGSIIMLIFLFENLLSLKVELEVSLSYYLDILNDYFKDYDFERITDFDLSHLNMILNNIILSYTSYRFVTLIAIKYNLNIICSNLVKKLLISRNNNYIIDEKIEYTVHKIKYLEYLIEKRVNYFNFIFDFIIKKQNRFSHDPRIDSSYSKKIISNIDFLY